MDTLPFKVLVCGGREYTNKEKVFSVLTALGGVPMGDVDNPSWLPRPDLVIMHGGARGADTLADGWAVTNWVPVEEYRADWDKYGKGAGFIRNKQMLEQGKPDLVIAFPGGRGTNNMIELAREANIAVEVIVDG